MPINNPIVASYNLIKIDKIITTSMCNQLFLLDIPYLPLSADREKLKQKFELALQTGTMEFDQNFYTYNKVCYCTVKIGGKNLHQIAPEYAISLRGQPDYFKFHGTLPRHGNNPIQKLSEDHAPLFNNVNYVAPYEVYTNRSKKELDLCRRLYSDTQNNRTNVSEKFSNFIKNGSSGEGVFELIADAGVGKTWWLNHKLANIAAENSGKLDVIYFDGRSRKMEDVLTSIDRSFCEQSKRFLSKVNLLRWLVEDELGEQYDPANQDHKDTYKINLERISSLELEREYRLDYYQAQDERKILVALDNIERFSDRELEILFSLMSDKFTLRKNVLLVIPMRNSTLSKRDRMTHGAMTVHTRVALQSPELKDMCLKRARTNLVGGESNADRHEIDRGQTLINVINKIFDEIDPRVCISVGTLMETLCTYQTDYGESTYAVDVRHFIRLMRSLLNASEVDSIERFSDVFYATQALMSEEDSKVDEYSSYLFNVLDDPDIVSGSLRPLHRLRILEFIKYNNPDVSAIEKFARKMQYPWGKVERTLEKFERAGLILAPILIDQDVNGEVEGDTGETEFRNRYSLDAPGRLHLEFLHNSWYLIICKSSCTVYFDNVVKGEKAREYAEKEGLGEVYSEHYARFGWIPDELYTKFLVNEEHLERQRIANCVHPIDKEWISEVYQEFVSPAQIVAENLTRSGLRKRRDVKKCLEEEG